MKINLPSHCSPTTIVTHEGKTDIQIAVGFLMTRVKEPDKDDCGK